MFRLDWCERALLAFGLTHHPPRSSKSGWNRMTWSQVLGTKPAFKMPLPASNIDHTDTCVLTAARPSRPTPPPTTAADVPAPEKPLREDDHVFVRDGDRCWFVPVRSIRLLEAEGNQTRLFFDEEKPLLYRSIGSLEERLPARLFLRANRSQLVNLAFIETIDPWFSGSLKATLRGGPEVEFSRRQAQLFRERMSL
jgi:two-component system, LytTR family, response regulator